MMKNVVIITSAINAKFSAIDAETRYQDTFKTIESVRKKMPNAIVAMFESSPQKLSDDMLEALKNKVDVFIVLSDVPKVNELGSNNQKSAAETLSLKLAIEHIMTLNIHIKRIFKLTGRGFFSEDFDVSYYDNPDLTGKYVFKKRIASWMSPELSLLSTRCWSFSYELLQEVLAMLENTMTGCLDTGRDVEHIIFEKLDTTKLVELEKIGYNCRISLNGNLECD